MSETTAFRVVPIHRNGSTKVDHYTATYWFRGVPKYSAQGATQKSARAELTHRSVGR